MSDSQELYYSDDPNVVPLASVHNIAHLVCNSNADVPMGFNDCFIYMIRLLMEGSRHGALCTLVHRRLFTEIELQEMSKKAIEAMVPRLTERRRATRIESGKSSADLKEANLDAFKADADFFGTAMCDKFDFRRVVMASTMAKLPPLINSAEAIPH